MLYSFAESHLGALSALNWIVRMQEIHWDLTGWFVGSRVAVWMEELHKSRAAERCVGGREKGRLLVGLGRGGGEGLKVLVSESKVRIKELTFVVHIEYLEESA